MKRSERVAEPVDAGGPDGTGAKLPPAQTLAKGMDVLMRVAKGDNTLAKMAASLDLNKTTAHRLATTLVEGDFLAYSARDGYTLGTKLLELGFAAHEQITLTRVCHDYLAKLSNDTGDTVNLGILDKEQVYYLEKLPGTRRIQVQCVVGERSPLRSTGLGKALLLDASEDRLREVYRREAGEFPNYKFDLKQWLDLMAGYRAQGLAFDLDENEEHVRCVAAPVRDVAGGIVAAVSLSSPVYYMTEDRMHAVKDYVGETAAQISAKLGYKGGAAG